MATTREQLCIGLTALTLALPVGCVVPADDDGAEFREAVPETATMRLGGPEDETGVTAPSSQLASVDEPWADGPWAKYYGFTRHVRDGINQVTLAVLGGVWLVIHSRPTEVSTAAASWGPWTDDLAPASYRFTITRNGDGSYRYRLEGKPKSASDEHYLTVLDGVGYKAQDPRHGQGGFTIDLGAANALDPQENPDRGQVRIDHELQPDPHQLPRTITAHAATDGEAWWTAKTHQTASGGTLLVDAHADVDSTQVTALEDVQIASQWQKDGAGRADVTLSGGDLPASIGMVTAVECWGSDFLRAYYTDSVGYAPTEGEPAACAFAAAPHD